MNKAAPKFGEIYLASLTAAGSIQGGKRPVLIAQNDIGNKHSPVVTIMPLTTRKKAEYMPTHTVISASSTNGLKTDSVVLVEQVHAINQTQLEYRIGELTRGELVDVGRACRTQLPFPVG